MNNSVKNGYGEIVGFRCWQCGGVFQSMWDTTCNGCRRKNDDNEKLRKEVSRLTEALSKLSNYSNQK